MIILFLGCIAATVFLGIQFAKGIIIIDEMGWNQEAKELAGSHIFLGLGSYLGALITGGLAIWILIRKLYPGG